MSALTAPAARAGSYSAAAYNGGDYTPDGAAQAQDGPLSGGGYGMNHQNGPCSCDGPITATFTWSDPNNPADPPPQSVIVAQSASVTWHGVGPGGATGSASDGLGDQYTTSSSTANLPPGWESDSGSSSLPSGEMHYSVKAGAQTVPLDPVTMTGRAGPSNSSGLYAGYGATLSPVTITLGGGAIKDGSTGNWDILIGQQCLPSLAGIPTGCKVSNYQWAGVGTANTFQKWDPSTTPPTYVSGPGALNVASPSWYWNEAMATETITCTATVTPPAGQGAPFPVTATQKVNVMVPTMSVSALAVGTGRINNDNPLSQAKSAGYYLYDGSTLKGQNPDPTQDHGEFWAGSVTTPALFPAGTWNFAQIITPSSTYTGPDGNTHNLANYGITGLDTSFPYGNSLPADGSAAGEGDPPGEQLLDANSVYNVNDQFTTYLMFMPSGGVWVPLGLLNNWSFVATNIMRPSSGGWSKYTPTSGVGTPTPGGDFKESHTFPTWTAVDK